MSITPKSCRKTIFRGSLKFAADRTLGRLAKWLRLLGFDTIYFNEIDDRAFLKLENVGRTLLTRDRKLVGKMSRGVFFEENDPDLQLKRLVGLLNLKLVPDLFFTRCHGCNSLVEPVEKSRIYGKVPDYIWNTYHCFSTCPSCKKVYWKGSHIERFQKRIDSLLDL